MANGERRPCVLGFPKLATCTDVSGKGTVDRLLLSTRGGRIPHKLALGAHGPPLWGPTRPATVVFERLRSLISGSYSLKNKKLVSKQQSRHRSHGIRIVMPRAAS